MIDRQAYVVTPPETSAERQLLRSCVLVLIFWKGTKAHFSGEDRMHFFCFLYFLSFHVPFALNSPRGTAAERRWSELCWSNVRWPLLNWWSPNFYTSNNDNWRFDLWPIHIFHMAKQTTHSCFLLHRQDKCCIQLRWEDWWQIWGLTRQAELHLQPFGRCLCGAGAIGFSGG